MPTLLKILMAERKGPFDRLRRNPLSLVVLLQRAIADLVDLIMVFYKKGCCFLWSFVKIKAVFLVCARVVLAGLSARKRGVLVEDRETQSLCCCCDSSGCLSWDLGLYCLV